MNDLDFERSLSEWLRDGRSTASRWVFESVAEHARRHPNQPWWRLTRRSVRSRDHVLFGLTTVAALATAALLVASLIVPAPAPHPEVLPGSSPESSPPATASPVVEPTGLPAAGGLTGSLWREDTSGKGTYVLLHPDGTTVSLPAGRGIGIGVWRPTGEHAMSTTIAYLDADPVDHIRYGFSTYHADWTIDRAAETATMTWTASFRPGDGSTMPDASGNATLTRLHVQALPPTARYPVAPESPWQPALGAMAGGPGSGGVATLDPCNPNDPPDYLVTHGDGTFLATGIDGGSGVGLWVTTGPGTRALTAWYGPRVGSGHVNWVGELGGSELISAQIGTSEAFDGFFMAEPVALEPMGDQLPRVDPGSWPRTGSVWLEPTEQGPAIIAYHTDGIVVARHPVYGTGVGLWQPIDGDTLTSSVGFASHTLQDHRIWSEATISPDGERLSIRYTHQESAGPVDTGAATATRLDVEAH